ncbi:hypothetical protein BDZ91DRAFT_714561 [Kalaharituber pfeilii]|nr:hypothetical protein BDZ91DRAFT_714561 [Kalaharituber pfeilii]
MTVMRDTGVNAIIYKRIVFMYIVLYHHITSFTSLFTVFETFTLLIIPLFFLHMIDSS